jgi:hypothetical protein
MDLLSDVQDHLNQILEPPPNFHGGVVRDSGVFLKCDEDEIFEQQQQQQRRMSGTASEDPEIILSPANLMNLNPGDSQIIVKPESGGGGRRGYSSIEEHYGEVRQRFLNAKSLFEASESSSSAPHKSGTGNGNESKAQFLYCEKSSDSGISLGANSPPPNRYE